MHKSDQKCDSEIDEQGPLGRMRRVVSTARARCCCRTRRGGLGAASARCSRSPEHGHRPGIRAGRRAERATWLGRQPEVSHLNAGQAAILAHWHPPKQIALKWSYCQWAGPSPPYVCFTLLFWGWSGGLPHSRSHVSPSRSLSESFFQVLHLRARGPPSQGPWTHPCEADLGSYTLACRPLNLAHPVECQ